MKGVATGPASLPASAVLLFTCTAGSLDALTFLIAHVFTANMTGNTVLLGLYVGQGDGTAALHSLVALLAYVAGVALGVVLSSDDRTPGAAHAAIVRAVVVEAAIVAIFAAVRWLSPAPEDLARTLVLVGLSGLAMGIQSATVMRLQLPGLMTTYITGTITTLVVGVVNRVRDRAPAAHATSERGTEHQRARQLMVFATYGLAALTSAVVHGRWPSAAVAIPLLAIVAVSLTLWRTPTVGAPGTGR